VPVRGDDNLHDFDHDDHDDELNFDCDFHFDFYDDRGPEADRARVVSALVVASLRQGEVEAQADPREGRRHLRRRDCEAVEAVEVAWCGWGADGCESDVFVCSAGSGAVGGSEFLY
jgi:hypothetical protein